MWSPLPRPKVIRRPRPLESFNHQRRKLAKRKNPLEFKPENHFGHRYFGIRHSDITDYLEKTIPSHAFAPANINTGTPSKHDRGKIGEQVRPSTAPAAIPWFGRSSSDVSDWLRQAPPAHLGLDPENKPLPYFPTKSSIVTDNRWQTRDFPPVPNVLWHYWAERQSSAPLPTAPHQMHFDTILNAIKKNRQQKPRTDVNFEPGPQSETSTPAPRSARSNPESRAETPRAPEAPPGAENDRGPSQSRPSSSKGGKHPGWPGTAEVALPCCQCGKRLAGCGSTTSTSNGKGEEANGSTLCRTCGCGKAQETPLSPTAKSQEPSPRSPKRPETPLTAEKVRRNKVAVEPCQATGCNSPGSAAGYPRPPLSPKIEERKPDYVSHRTPPSPTISKDRPDPHNYPKAPPAPFHEVIRNSRKAPEKQDHSNKGNGTECGNWEETTADRCRLMSPDSYATKVVWQDNFRKYNKANSWPIKVH